jgi:hypothetical protein
MQDREARKRRGEIREHTGLAIINSYGGLWDNRLFDRPEDALAYLKEHYDDQNIGNFKLAMAVQTTEIYSGLSEPEFIPFPNSKREAAPSAE